MRLWKDRTGIDWQRPVLPWLLTTTRRLAIDRFRTLRRRLLKSSKASFTDTAVVDRWLDVQAAMAALSPLERTALILVAVEGVTYAESAAILGTSGGALRAAVSRARDKLESAR